MSRIPALRQLEVRPAAFLPKRAPLLRVVPNESKSIDLFERPNAVAIVCAKNEGPRIANVLSALKGVLPVLVVDDGSTDDTAAVAKAHGATVVSLPKNVGKGQAMYMGTMMCGFADRIMFLDADLTGLRADHVRKLLDSLDQKPDLGMVVGLRDYGEKKNESDRNMPLISGERVVRREVLRAMPKHGWDGYAVETWLNHTCASLDYDIGTVVLDGVFIVYKWEKNAAKGVAEMADMAANVVLANEQAATNELRVAPRPPSMASRGMSTEEVLDEFTKSIVKASAPYVREHVWTPEARAQIGAEMGKRIARPIWVVGAVFVGVYVGFFAGISVTLIGLLHHRKVV